MPHATIFTIIFAKTRTKKYSPKFKVTLSQATAVLKCCSFPLYRLPSTVGKVSVTEIRTLYLSIGFSSPLGYILMTTFTILDIVLCSEVNKRQGHPKCPVTTDVFAYGIEFQLAHLKWSQIYFSCFNDVFKRSLINRIEFPTD